MKVIPKFQSGGSSFDSFFTMYTPVETTSKTSQQKSSKTSESSDGELTEKDFFNMLKNVDGLPNEMSAIVSDLISTFKLNSLTGIDTGSLATTYLQNLYKIKVATQNKATYDKAVEQANKNGSMAEPAISMDGKLIVQNLDGEITTISLSNYFENENQYELLTVSNLANLRAYSPELAYNPEVFNIINNSMGFESFQELLKQAIRILGESEYTRNGMFSVEGSASKGLELLQTLRNDDRLQTKGSITAEGLYKYKIIDKTQLQQIESMLSYITSILPDRAKTWAAFKMRTSDKNKATNDLVLQYLLSGSKSTHSFDIDYEGSMDKVTKGSESSDDAKMTFLTALQNGYGGRDETRTLNFGNNTSFNVTGTAYGASQSIDKKVVVNATLESLLSETGIAGITNSDSIVFGDNIIKSNQFSKIAIDNNGGFWAVLPCIKRGSSTVPNFELINEFNEVVKEVINESSDNTSPDQKYILLEQKIQNKPELQELLTISGKLDSSKFQAFYIVDGLASDQNFTFKNSDETDISKNSNPLISETSSKEDIDYFKLVTNQKFDENEWYDPWYDKLYRSKIFIPIQTNNRLAAIIFSGQQIKDDNAMTLEGEYQRFQITNKMNTPLSKYLWK